MSNPFSVCVSRARLAVRTIAGVLATASVVHSQAELEFRVSFNGALGVPTVVADGGPADLDPTPGEVMAAIPTQTDGVMTLAPGATISGTSFAFGGRLLVLTGVLASVNAGQFQSPPGTIDIYACYRFNRPGLVVPAPNVCLRSIDGSFVNAVDGTIDFALVRFNGACNGACVITPTDAGFFQQTAGPGAIAPVPFSDSVTYPISSTPGVDLTMVTRLAVANNGDGVTLPASASLRITPIRTDIPAMTPVGTLLMIAAFVATAALVYLRRSRNDRTREAPSIV